MKLVLLFVLLVGLAHAAVNESRLLKAIAMVEGGSRDGKHHEKGAFQMTPEAVRYAGGYDYAAALRWLRHLESVLLARGVDVNVFNLALTWNAGVANVLHGRAPLSSYDYGTRTANLYRSNTR